MCINFVSLWFSLTLIFVFQKSKCSDDSAKLEATKRRLQESYQQAENG